MEALIPQDLERQNKRISTKYAKSKVKRRRDSANVRAPEDHFFFFFEQRCA